MPFTMGETETKPTEAVPVDFAEHLRAMKKQADDHRRRHLASIPPEIIKEAAKERGFRVRESYDRYRGHVVNLWWDGGEAMEKGTP